MTGFKSGASDDDPLEDDGEKADEPSPTAENNGPDESPVSEPDSSTSSGLPWIYARNGITDGRARTVQLHLQQSTLERERGALSDVDIDESVNKADLREAAYIVGMRHLSEVADQLREWGYDTE